MMFGFLAGLAAVSGVLYLYLALAKQRLFWKYVLKPGTMVFIILMATVEMTGTGSFGKWVVAALVLSIFGDVFLMLEREKDYFVHGLFSFLLGHLAYIAAFLFAMEKVAESGISIATSWTLVLIGAAFFLLLRKHVHAEGGVPLVGAVAFYIGVISLMVWGAVMTGEAMLIVGALLFYVSDAVLAFDKFVKSFRAAEYMVMVTYFSAQFVFALSLRILF